MESNKPNKRKKTFIIVAAIMGVVVIFGTYSFRTYSKKLEQWNPTFVNNDTKAFDTYICYHLLSDIFDGHIISTRKPIYNNLKDSLNTYFNYNNPNQTSESQDAYDPDQTQYNKIEQALDTNTIELNSEDVDNSLALYDGIELSDTTSYIFINKKFSLDDVDLEYLLDFAGIGNNVFISAEWIDSKILDTLRIKDNIDTFSADSIYHFTDNPSKKYNIKTVLVNTTLSMDSCQLPFRILAENNKHKAVLVQIRYGKGNIFLNTTPKAFTNFLMVDKKKYDFAFKNLSYLPRNNKIIWDEYQTQGPVNSIFQELLEQPPLIIVLIITIIGFILFIIFRAKREQRTIPIIIPPINSSIEFLDTISNLYYKKKDFKTIVSKRHAYFLDYIRKHYYMSTENINADFIENLAIKSGFDKESLILLFNLHNEITQDNSVSNEIFLQYNRILDEFYKDIRNK